MTTPELKQFGDLSAEDFRHHPVWIACHTVDQDEPWFQDTDEETFRPYTARLPADPRAGMLLVRASFTLHDGSRYPGFFTPGSSLDTQQPHIFVDDRCFAFWGGIAGIPEPAQQDFYAALGKPPEAVFPIHFAADPHLVTETAQGQVAGFYTQSREGIHVSSVLPGAGKTSAPTPGAPWFQMFARSSRGYPQPERDFEYRKLVYADPCLRCGIYAQQIAPFRFKKSKLSPAEFTQLHWVHDAFFVSPAILEEILYAGITGVSAAPAAHQDKGEPCADLTQLLAPTVIACVETSRLPTVTCRPDNEETLALRALVAGRKSSTPPYVVPPDVQHHLRAHCEAIAAIPYCGRIKYHPPTSLALLPDQLQGAPDLFQTAEWFGSGRLAFRLTLASERFVRLVQERRWKGLEFRSVAQSGWSERKSTD